METNDDGSDYVVGILFVSFLIISVVMLVNILIALLTNTYNKVEVKKSLSLHPPPTHLFQLEMKQSV